MLTIRHYRIFQKVAEKRNMSLAAKSLYISQPTVSQTISEIENHYNSKLFERFPKTLYLTPAGEILLRECSRLLYMYDQISDLNLTGGKLTLRIGATHTIAETVLPEILHKADPSRNIYDFTVNITNTDNIESLILKNQLDFGIIEGIIRNNDIISMPVMNDTLVFICNPSHRLLKEENKTLQCLDREDFILREKGSGTRKAFEELMNNHHISYNVKWECASFSAIKNAVINGRGIGVISSRMISEELLRNELSILDVDMKWERNFFLCYHKNKLLTKDLQPFIDAAISL